jgi:hypothetical protein
MNAEQAKLVIELGLMCEFFSGRDVRPSWRGTLSGMDPEGFWDEDMRCSYDRCRVMPGMQVVLPEEDGYIVKQLQNAGVSCYYTGTVDWKGEWYAVIEFIEDTP